ncbi:BQ2448_1049 [Microbotryum intermedium]|uniref:BQ2448_1049 protein n=1 Tax=Microbotryum intermedium TaxID=269621 RepID=A0A238F8X5_9BASI|nr:BQ2448_1049 [Microbotryum intermedium]
MTGSKSTSRPQRLRFRPKQRPKKLAEMDDLPSELLSCIFEHLRELGVRASEMARLALVQKSWRHVAQAEMCRVLELHHCDAIFSLVDSGLLSRHPVQELTVTRQVGFATDEVLASIRGLKKFTATNVGIEIPALLTDGLQGTLAINPFQALFNKSFDLIDEPSCADRSHRALVQRCCPPSHRVLRA